MAAEGTGHHSASRPLHDPAAAAALRKLGFVEYGRLPQLDGQAPEIFLYIDVVTDAPSDC